MPRIECPCPHPTVHAVSANTSMKVLPMILRLVSDRLTPANAKPKTFFSIHATHFNAHVFSKDLHHLVAFMEPCNKPLSTNTQVSCSPIAFSETVAATTELSTPPESPNNTCSSPICSVQFAPRISMMLSGVHALAQPQIWCTNRLINASPCSVWVTSG